MPLSIGLRIQKLMDLCESEANLVYVVSYKTARATGRIPVLKNNNKSHQVVQAFNPSTQVAEGGVSL